MSRKHKQSSMDPKVGVSFQELEELCKVHSISLELIRKSDNLDDLMDVILDELERRLKEIPENTFQNGAEPDLGVRDNARLKALMTFAGQAAELKAKAEFTHELQQALFEAETGSDRLRGVIDSIAAGVVVLDRDGKVIEANREVEELIGKDQDDLLGEPFEPWIEKVEANSDGEIHVRMPGAGESLRVRLVARRDLNGAAGGEVVLINDITERDRIVRERHYKEKMHGLMQTIGMLTHQINNPLTSLLGRAQILRMKASGNEDVLKSAAVIEESARRISGLIQDLSELARTGDREELEDMIDRGLEAGPADRRKT